MELVVYKKDGSATGEKVQLSPEIFEVKPNDNAIYQTVRAYLANQRQGTHKTKTVSEVRGSGKKPWRQKHTGRARVGTHRSPLWKGGGTIFGPVLRDYSMKVPARVKKLARATALSYKAKSSEITVVEDFTLDAPKTKEIVNILRALKLDGKKTLMLLPSKNNTVFRSGRNIPGLVVVEAAKASTYDIVNSTSLLFQKSAVEVLQKTFAP
jgi:large subunit ribosomal protein L4